MTKTDKKNEIFILQEILNEIKNMSKYLQKIETYFTDSNLTSIKPDQEVDTSSSTSSSMPSSLDILQLQESRPGIFKTYKAIQKHDEWVTSTDVAVDTGRTRGLESRYLNFLATSGFIQKKRVKISPDGKATEVLYKSGGK